MSSDYLNYELSKELKELGVVFEGESLWTSQIEDQALVHSTGRLRENCICHPSTAQLIDEIQKRSRILYLDYTESIKCYCVEVYEAEGNDPCATTALGKALIALVKEDRKCQVSKTS